MQVIVSAHLKRSFYCFHLLYTFFSKKKPLHPLYFSAVVTAVQSSIHSKSIQLFQMTKKKTFNKQTNKKFHNH